MYFLASALAAASSPPVSSSDIQRLSIEFKFSEQACVYVRMCVCSSAIRHPLGARVDLRFLLLP